MVTSVKKKTVKQKISKVTQKPPIFQDSKLIGKYRMSSLHLWSSRNIQFDCYTYLQIEMFSDKIWQDEIEIEIFLYTFKYLTYFLLTSEN